MCFLQESVLEKKKSDNFLAEVTAKFDIDLDSGKLYSRFSGKAAGYVNAKGYLVVRADKLYKVHRIIFAAASGRWQLA